ncbi:MULTISPECIES: holin [unclassified Streptomyces]|uniref:holin n=1 Tax=unclassified Streptomyces TaxID=2593676 RepID=UPI0034375ABA
MARRRARTVCSRPGCPKLTDTGRCPDCRRDADRVRGGARQRGYGREHETRFRVGVLARDPVCVLCRQAPSVHADHYPLDRRALVAAGLDPDDPRHGRGLCGPCHSSETAREQPGGWNR